MRKIIQKPPLMIAVTLGDPGGIGPEILLKSFPKARRLLAATGQRLPVFICVGSFSILQYYQKRLRLTCRLRLLPHEAMSFSENQKRLCSPDLDPSWLYVLEPKGISSKFALGKISKANAQVSLASLDLAASLAMGGWVKALVTAPLHKAACRQVKATFTGHTGYLAEKTGIRQHAMLLSGAGLRVILATEHVPLKDVSKHLKPEILVEKIFLADTYLKKYQGIRFPRIALAGLNPHAGESGEFGKEESVVFMPAIRALKKRGIRVSGPVSGDTVFYQALAGKYDLVVAMYHDQGLAPLKTVAFETAINCTLGLGFIRTSPDHGTAFDIAGTNQANPQSMIEAMTQAALMSMKAGS